MTGLGAILAWLYVSTIFAVPLILFEGRSIVAQCARVRADDGCAAQDWRVCARLASLEHACRIRCSLGLRSCGRARAFKRRARPSALVPAVAVLLACHAFLLAVLSFVAVAIHCLLIMRLYLVRGGKFTAERNAGTTRLTLWIDPLWRRVVRFKLAAVAAVPILIAAGGFVVAGKLKVDEPVFVVAHRGFARGVPENTLSAFRKAIEAGADMIELDVQETRDGVIVVLHDRDLMRLVRDPRAITDLTYAEARRIQLGGAPSVTGGEVDHIPTLSEAIALRAVRSSFRSS